jgi:hypothetical protein
MKGALCCLLLTVFIQSAEAAGDPFLGRWFLDVMQSKYPVGQCPKSMTIVMEAAGKGIHYKSDTTYWNGSITHSEYSGNYDGKTVIVGGTRGLMLPVSLRRIDSRTALASYSKGLTVVATSRRVVSVDGRFMTITTKSKDVSGNTVSTVAVFVRQ